VHNKFTKYILSAVFMIIIAVFLIQVSSIISKENITSAENIYTDTGFYFDTFVTFTIYDDTMTKENAEEIFLNAFNLCEYYEHIFSRNLSDSELSKLNNTISQNSHTFNPDFNYSISEELKDLINIGLEYSTLTDNSFDITLGKLTRLWDFKAKKIPSDKEISEALLYDEIDLGGIAKGYIADKLKEYFSSQNVYSGIINLGGNILLIGSKPDGKPFNIGIKKPFDEGNNIAIACLSDLSIVTSGIYERYFISDDILFHHIIDPSTGYPVNNHIYSVTIISNSSTTADALSTSCLVLGMDKALTLINSLDNTYCIIIKDDYDIITSDGINMDINGNITIEAN